MLSPRGRKILWRDSASCAGGKSRYLDEMVKSLPDAERERFFQSAGTIVEAFEDSGVKLTPIDPEECRRGKEEDRLEDQRLLASGEMTADQLHERNAFFKGPVKVQDKSPSYR